MRINILIIIGTFKYINTQHVYRIILLSLIIRIKLDEVLDKQKFMSS